MYPYVFGLSRTSLPDFALTAMVAFSLCCLIYTENFTNKPFSLLFGISLGLGMLIKQVFAFFIIAPFVFVILEIFLKQKMDSSRVKNLIIAFLASIFSGGYWYFLNLKQILPNYMRAAYVDAHMFGPHHFCSLNSLVYYFNQLGRDQMLPFFCFIFVVGAFMFFRSKIKNKLFWLSSIVGAYLIFTVLIMTKEPKSTVPYLSFFAIISAAGILNIRNVELKKSLVVFLVVFGLYQFCIISYTSLSARRDNFPLVGLLIPKRNLTSITSFHHYYSRQDLGVSQVLSVIEEQEKTAK